MEIEENDFPLADQVADDIKIKPPPEGPPDSPAILRWFLEIIFSLSTFIQQVGHLGVVAQLGERLLCTQGVAGSSPADSTLTKGRK